MKFKIVSKIEKILDKFILRNYNINKVSKIETKGEIAWYHLQ